MLQKAVLVCTTMLTVANCVCAQKVQVIADTTGRLPVAFANVFVLKLKQGVISDSAGVIQFQVGGVNEDDTIVITHVSYQNKYVTWRDFILLDTISLVPKSRSLTEIVVKAPAKTYKHRTVLGYFQHKYDGSVWFRSGFQVGVKIDNPNHLEGIVSSVRIHFEQIAPNARFRIRLKEIKDDGTIGDDFIEEGILLKPTTLKPEIDLKQFGVVFPSNGLFVCLDNLGDGNSYTSRGDEPVSKLRYSLRHPESNTYNNYGDGYLWDHWNFRFGNKNPANVQIQISVLSN